MKHTESATKIYWTNNYGDFRFLKGNRDVNEPKVKKMMKVIDSEGYDMLKYAPIIVDEEMTILDGQHRFVVCQQLKKPVYYVIVSGFGLEGVTKINSNSSNWRSGDYLNSYIDLKKPAYVKIKEISDLYGCAPTLVACMLHSGNASSPHIVSTFKDGEIEIKYEEQTIKYLDRCKEFTPYMDNPFCRSMTMAVIVTYDNGKYDHDLMLQKLETSGRRIERVNSLKVVLQEIEEIINYRQQKRVVIY